MYVGHITLGDDLDLALVAFKQVREQLPEAQLAIVGTGEGLVRLRSLSAELGLTDAVHFTGWIDHSQVPAFLSAADAAIYPYRDTLINRAKCSIKILEYMAMGKAIVTNRVGQNTEYLVHEQSGVLVEPGDVDAFARGLLAVLTNRSLAERLGRGAAQRVDKEFNWSRRIIVVERGYRDAYHPSR
jgi:glycosyltransferase involved in cell wall biosynthesis